MLLDQQNYFNSHPHKEDDTFENKSVISYTISTHILTRRMTPMKHPNSSNFYISTHILTRRMTMFPWHSSGIIPYFNSHPHEEDDNIVVSYTSCKIHISTHILTRKMTIHRRIMSIILEYFNSHPHEEDDFMSRFKSSPSVISTHILTRRMTQEEGQS